MNEIEELVKIASEFILINLNKDITGHNGPYRDPETYIRYKSHSICLLCNTDRHNSNKEYVRKLSNEILGSSYLLNNGFFINRFKIGKDQVNGVIGLAWVIEALSLAYRKYNFLEIKDFLLNIENKIRFNEDRKLWSAPKSDTLNSWKIDNNFNHQLWLAYSLCLKSKVLNQPISDNTRCFFDFLEIHLSTHNDGLIKHSISNNSTLKSRLKEKAKEIRDLTNCWIYNKTKRYKENGYHLFNMFAFARLKHEGFGELFEESRAFKSALKYCSNPNLFSCLNSNNESKDFYKILPPSNLKFNRYGIPYNVSGLEFYYISKIFNLPSCDGSDLLMKNQLQSYNFGNLEKSKTEDVVNFILRTYEASF